MLEASKKAARPEWTRGFAAMCFLEPLLAYNFTTLLSGGRFFTLRRGTLYKNRNIEELAVWTSRIKSLL
jgi:hypothetical protein